MFLKLIRDQGRIVKSFSGLLKVGASGKAHALSTLPLCFHYDQTALCYYHHCIIKAIMSLSESSVMMSSSHQHRLLRFACHDKTLHRLLKI